MVWSFAVLLAVILVESQCYPPKFKVFEIRKARDPDDRIDFHYYDPDFERIQSAIHREKDNSRLLRLADNIAKRLRLLSQRNERDSSSSSSSDSGFVDETRSVLVIPDDDVIHMNPDKENILQKLIQSALRTNIDDVEDRTAPPMHRIPYDYD